MALCRSTVGRARGGAAPAQVMHCSHQAEPSSSSKGRSREARMMLRWFRNKTVDRARPRGMPPHISAHAAFMRRACAEWWGGRMLRPASSSPGPTKTTVMNTSLHA